MKLIVGLGNPGAQYERTRHNAGFLLADRLASRHAPGGIARARFHGVTLEAQVRGERCLLLKPTTFMNRSGQSVGEAVRFFKLEPATDMIVLVDDVALPVGAVRLRPSGGTGGHNGLADIDRVLGGAPFPRCRIGVGKPPARVVQSDWVLGRFFDEEKEDLERSLEEAADAVECFVAEGIDAAMNRFNRRLDTGGDAPAGA